MRLSPLFFPQIYVFYRVENMIFIDVPAYRIQHKFFVYLFRGVVIKPTEFFVFLDVSKKTFRLYRTDLSVQYLPYADIRCGLRIRIPLMSVYNHPVLL